MHRREGQHLQVEREGCKRTCGCDESRRSHRTAPSQASASPGASFGRASLRNPSLALAPRLPTKKKVEETHSSRLLVGRRLQRPLPPLPHRPHHLQLLPNLPLLLLPPPPLLLHLPPHFSQLLPNATFYLQHLDHRCLDSLTPLPSLGRALRQVDLLLCAAHRQSSLETDEVGADKVEAGDEMVLRPLRDVCEERQRSTPLEAHERNTPCASASVPWFPDMVLTKAEEAWSACPRPVLSLGVGVRAPNRAEGATEVGRSGTRSKLYPPMLSKSTRRVVGVGASRSCPVGAGGGRSCVVGRAFKRGEGTVVEGGPKGE